MSNLTAHAKALRNQADWLRKLMPNGLAETANTMEAVADHIDNVQPLYEAVVEAAKEYETVFYDERSTPQCRGCALEELENALAALREYKEKQGE